MQKRLPLVVGALALGAALVGVALLVFDWESPTNSDLEISHLSGPEIEGALVPASTSSSDAGSGGRLLAKRYSAADDDPSRAKGAEGELTEVEIIRAGTGEPVPDATVSWWPSSGTLDGSEEFETRLRNSALEERSGSAVWLQSDFRGRVKVPDLGLGCIVAAESGELWGYKAFGVDRANPMRVEIAPDGDLRVKVVDERGAPVFDTPVVLRRQLGGSAHLDCVTARTRKPDGVAVLRHSIHFLRREPGRGAAFVVALQGLFDRTPQQAIDHDHPPKEVVRLVLPLTGSCEVVVVDENNHVVLGGIEARLRFADSAPADGRDSARSRQAMTSRDGRVVFENVALGRVLSVEVLREGADAPEEVGGPGPERPGQRVQLRHRLGADSVVLRGRIVDPTGPVSGGALARARLEASDPDIQFEEGAWFVRAAPDGRFSVVAKPMADLPEGLKLAVYRLSERGVDSAVARRPLPSDMRGGSHDLGDFVFVDVPIAAEGIVVDADGKPVASASVIPSIPAAANGDDPEAPRSSHALRSGTTDGRGRFEIGGEVPHAELALVAQKAGLIAEPVVVKTGERGVRLILGVVGAVEGAVRLDPSLPASMVLVETTREGSGSAPSATRIEKPCLLGGDGRFAVRGLRPGKHTVRLFYAGARCEIASVPEVVVEAGKTTRDPRIDPLDLRNVCRLIALDVVDGRGDPVRDADGFSRPSDDAKSGWLPFDRQGEHLQLLVRSTQAVEAVITAPGFLRTRLERVTASQRVTLLPAARVRLRLAEGLSAPQPPLSLDVELRPAGADRGPASAETTRLSFDRNGEAVGQLPFNGEATVQLALRLPEKGPSGVAALEHEAPKVIAVGSEAGEQVFEIRFDPAKLQAAVRSITNE